MFKQLRDTKEAIGMKISVSTTGLEVAPFLVIGSGIAGLYTALKLAELAESIKAVSLLQNLVAFEQSDSLLTSISLRQRRPS